MTISPKKHVSTFTTSTNNRGVEAKEVEITNIHLDTSTQLSSQPTTDCSRTSSALPPSPPSRDDSASYIQVLVQKQRRRATNVAPRLPQPSSPVAPLTPPPAPAVECPKHVPHSPPVNRTANANLIHNSAKAHLATHAHVAPNGHSTDLTACGVCNTWPDALLACPALAALHQSCRFNAAQAAVCEQKGVRPTSGPPQRDNVREKGNKMSLWRKVSSITKEDLDSLDGPERLDVYRFETGNATLSARGAAPTHLERMLRRSARPAARLLAELLAAPRLLASLPAALLLVMLRTALTPVRDTAVGVVQTLSDYILKPALALAFNALLQPALVCAAQCARALREALRPLALAAGDAVEPAARLLAALRLVQLEHRCNCTQAV